MKLTHNGVRPREFAAWQASAACARAATFVWCDIQQRNCDDERKHAEQCSGSRLRFCALRHCRTGAKHVLLIDVRVCGNTRAPWKIFIVIYAELMT